MATRGPFGQDLSGKFNYSDAVQRALNDIVITSSDPVYTVFLVIFFIFKIEAAVRTEYTKISCRSSLSEKHKFCKKS